MKTVDTQTEACTKIQIHTQNKHVYKKNIYTEKKTCIHAQRHGKGNIFCCNVVLIILSSLQRCCVIGSAFAVNSTFFKKIGTYDTGMKIWGGENLELSWQVSKQAHSVRPPQIHYPHKVHIITFFIFLKFIILLFHRRYKL